MKTEKEYADELVEQDEYRMQCELIQCEINVLSETIEMLESRVETYKAKLEVLKERKKSIELYNQK